MTQMKVLLITPPFTQINTPYPATAFLKRFLVLKGVPVKQVDLGIELILSIFNQKGLKKVFQHPGINKSKLRKPSKITFQQQERYILTIDTIINFLQSRETSLAYAICRNGFLPFAERFNQPLDLEWIFGTQGIIDKACYLSTLYLEELFDFINSELDPDFGFSRYAEKIALSATDFSDIHEKLQSDESFIYPILKQLLITHISLCKPDLVAITIPFPGCLFGTLQCGKIIKEYDSSIKIAIGGGYVNTELRDLQEEKIFSYIDYVTLDQGEMPLFQIVQYMSDKQSSASFSRTFVKQDKFLNYIEGNISDAPFSETGYPDYSDLELNRYLSIIELPNPMHRLWNDGKWNKIMIARGCYWKKCAFCDITLDYINNYEIVSAAIIVDRMEKIIAETGQTGFHFVDEAAPPALLKQVALELLKRNLSVSWWGNIRFEKNFNRDLCRLLAKSGCIAVSGGLETVSDRLLKLMNKGITIHQAVHVLRNFASAGILVHAYLMYGFPTQTEQETIDSLEIVRQLFDANLLQSCYWHRFSLTAHSLVAKDPQKFNIEITGPPKGAFAWNDLEHSDLKGCQHEEFSQGLKKAVYNYMFEVGIEFDLSEWFEFDIPRSTISPDLVELLIQSQQNQQPKLKAKQLVWLGNQPELVSKSTKHKKQKTSLKFISDNMLGVSSIKVDHKTGVWLCDLLSRISTISGYPLTIQQVSEEYKQITKKSFQDFFASELGISLNQFGLIAV